MYQTLSLPDQHRLIHKRPTLAKGWLWMPFAIASFASSTGLVLGQLAPSEAAPVDQQSGLVTQPIASNLEFVSQLLETQLKKDLKSIGKVEDVAFDLETEHLALLVASNVINDGSKRYALLPFIPGDRLIQYDWEKKLTLTSQPLAAARRNAAELYRDYKLGVYWLDFAKKKVAESNGTFDESDFPLTFYSQLNQWPVLDNEQHPVGQVVDVAIKSSNGEILYLVLVSDNSDKRAVPLGAFVSKAGANYWTIDLNTEQIHQFQPFNSKRPPVRVDRGWDEYVATRYGRGGLQIVK